MITQKEYARRRDRFFLQMIPNSVAVIFAAPEQLRTHNKYYFYRQNSDLFYFIGYPEPEAVAVFVKDRKGETKFLLFNRDRDVLAEQWTGKRFGQEGAEKHFAAYKATSINKLDDEMPLIFENKTRIYHAYGRNQDDDSCIMRWINAVRNKARSGICIPTEIIDIESIIHEMRAIKDKAEIEIIAKSASIGAEAMVRAIKACHPGAYEYEIAAELHYVYQCYGAIETAFNTIVATGENSCVLHYETLREQLKDGDLVLIDAGCEYQNYVSDITRTVPVNGKFSKAQKAIYAIVLKAQLAGIEELHPGNSYYAAQETAIRIITEGLVELGILKGKVDTLIAEEAYRPFYMHYFSHWLGMDGHDPVPYKIDGRWRTLQPGMVMSAEPGIYIREGMEGVDPSFWNIGVRIEDDVLITENGNHVLSASAPKTIDAIEALMKEKS